jgi:hypothetical protein
LAADLLKRAFLAGFLRQNEPYFVQNREKPEKTCGNRRNRVDKKFRKAEGELRTVLRTRMDIDDFALKQGMRLAQFSGGFRRAGRQIYF